MGISNFYFQPQAIPTLVVLLLAPLFLGLGFWQLDRAEQKRAMAANQEARRKLPPLRLNDEQLDKGAAQYRKLAARGRYLARKTVFIENRKHRGKTGFHVVTPLCLPGDGRCLLVNRGWISAAGAEQKLASHTSEAVVEVTGEAAIPEPPALELNAEAARVTNRWPFITLDAYRDWSGLDIYPFMLLQSANDQRGFVRNWPQAKPNDGMHIGYAIQWFAFAVIALVIWLFLSLRRPASTDAES